MKKPEIVGWIFAFATLLSILAASLYHSNLLAFGDKIIYPKPKFVNNQCFVKGLKEPWDTEVTGKVIRVGYLKYLIMYASEADRKSLGTKQGWEEDIRTFDLKYNPAPCPKGWNHEK